MIPSICYYTPARTMIVRAMLLHPCMHSDLRPTGSVHANWILHKQWCVITLFLVEAMLWQLHLCNNNREHAERISTVIMEAD